MGVGKGRPLLFFMAMRKILPVYLLEPVVSKSGSYILFFPPYSPICFKEERISVG